MLFLALIILVAEIILINSTGQFYPYQILTMAVQQWDCCILLI